MSKLGKIVKDTIKAKKESVMGKLGDSPYEDPMEPWSAKFNAPIKNEEALTEDSILYRYIRSKGYSPEHMDFAHRSAFARSNAFKTYKVMHQNKKKVATGGIHDIKVAAKEEVEHLDEAGVGKLMNFIKAKGLDPTSMDGNHKKHYSRSSEYRVFKTVHPDPDEARAKHKERTEKKKPKKKLNEISASGEGGADWNENTEPFVKVKAKKPHTHEVFHNKTGQVIGKYSSLSRAHRAADKKDNEYGGYAHSVRPIKESVDKADTVTMDIPLLIRVLEYAREDAKTDMDLHKVVENLINMRGKGVMSMDMYNKIVAIKEAIEEADEAKYGEKYQAAVKRVGQKAAQKPVDMKSLAARMQASYAKEKKPLKELKKQDDNQDIESSLAREEVEEISELKKSTLSSYIKKSTREVGAHSSEYRSLSDKADKFQSKADKMANKAKTDSDLEKQQVHQQDANNMRDFAYRHLSKSAKREKGIATAADKLAKEEVEEISELSKTALKSYISKRGETIHADKRDSNSARNKAADLEYHGKQKDADDWHDEADWLHNRARKGATNVTKAAIKVAKKTDEEVVTEGIGGIEDSPMSATNSVKAMESDCSCDTRKQQAMKSARMIKSLYKKKLKESTYDWEKDDKGGKAPTAKIVVKGGKTLTGKDRDTVEIEPVLKTRPNSAKVMKPGV